MPRSACVPLGNTARNGFKAKSGPIKLALPLMEVNPGEEFDLEITISGLPPTPVKF